MCQKRRGGDVLQLMNCGLIRTMIQIHLCRLLLPHHLGSQQLFFAHGSQLVQYNVGVNITTGETLAILIRIYQTTTKTEDALQQKRVQLPAVLIRKKRTDKITQWTVDSRPIKNNCAKGPHGPKTILSFFLTKRNKCPSIASISGKKR